MHVKMSSSNACENVFKVVPILSHTLGTGIVVPKKLPRLGLVTLMLCPWNCRVTTWQAIACNVNVIFSLWNNAGITSKSHAMLVPIKLADTLIPGDAGIILGMSLANESRHYYVMPPLIGWAHIQWFLGMGLANERRRYYVTPPLIGWAHTQNDPWWCHVALTVLG